MPSRARGGVSQARWKHEDPLQWIESSKRAGVKASDAQVGVADPLLWVWADADLLPSGAVLSSARRATFDERWPYTGRRGWRPTSNKVNGTGDRSLTTGVGGGLPFRADR